MKRHAAELLTRDPERFFHHDRVFLNNPVVMQGMGLAPLVVLATSGQNALMLAVAVALLLTPSRMLACLLSRLFPLREEHPANAELEKKLHGVRPCAEPSRPAHGQYAGRRLHRAGRAVCRLAHAGQEV